MNPWLAKAAVLIGSVLLVVIPARIHRAPPAEVIKSHRTVSERILLGLVSCGFVLPLVWIATPLFAFADYPLHIVPFAAGIVCMTAGLWLLHRSHSDLAENWSISLEIRENHRLITHGVYRRVRHPMYSALLLYALGQALLLPNWLAGPAYFVALLVLFARRIGREERMMADEFGEQYAAYAAATKQLIPRIW